MKVDKIESELSQLSGVSRQDLSNLWFKQFKHPPPKGVKRGLLERAASYKLQSRRHGGLNPRTLRTLFSIASGRDVKMVVSTPSLNTGTKLVREWHGKTHQVDVTDDGFVWNDKNYKSLSAIAKAITGTKWSGPRFFGVRS